MPEWMGKWVPQERYEMELAKQGITLDEFGEQVLPVAEGDEPAADEALPNKPKRSRRSRAAAQTAITEATGLDITLED